VESGEREETVARAMLRCGFAGSGRRELGSLVHPIRKRKWFRISGFTLFQWRRKGINLNK
jgi:hypothetical protein